MELMNLPSFASISMVLSIEVELAHAKRAPRRRLPAGSSVQ
jgi:hypothetical protein